MDRQAITVITDLALVLTKTDALIFPKLVCERALALNRIPMSLCKHSSKLPLNVRFT